MIKTITKDPDSWPPENRPWMACKPGDVMCEDGVHLVVAYRKGAFFTDSVTGEISTPMKKLEGRTWILIDDLLALFTGEKLLVDRGDLKEALAILRNGTYGVHLERVKDITAKLESILNEV